MTSFKDWQLGSSTSIFGGYHDDLFADYVKNGIKCAEISAPYKFLFNEFDIKNNYKKIIDSAKENNIYLNSFHLPYWKELDISQSENNISQKTIDTQKGMLNILEKMQIKTAVIHPSYAPITPEERPKRLEECKKSLDILSEYANNCGVTLAVEDLSATAIGNTTDELLYLVADNPLLKICFDTNHLVRQDNIEFVKKAGKYIITVHVSDYHLENELHLMPGEGKNDWQGIIKALEEADYKGPFMFEIWKMHGYTIDGIKTCHDKLLAEYNT